MGDAWFETPALLHFTPPHGSSLEPIVRLFSFALSNSRALRVGSIDKLGWGNGRCGKNGTNEWMKRDALGKASSVEPSSPWVKRGDTHALALHLFFGRWTSGALGIGKPVVGILSFMWGSEGTSGSLHEQTLWMRRSPRCGRGGGEGRDDLEFYSERILSQVRCLGLRTGGNVPELRSFITTWDDTRPCSHSSNFYEGNSGSLNNNVASLTS